MRIKQQSVLFFSAITFLVTTPSIDKKSLFLNKRETSYFSRIEDICNEAFAKNAKVHYYLRG